MSNEQTNNPIDTHAISRRQLLKALAATGGAATLAAMSGGWVKPLVEVGVLPAHAQGSAPGPVPGPVCPIVRTVTVGTAPGNSTLTYYAFATPITDAEITACAPTTITYAWTGDPSPAVFPYTVGIWLAQSVGVYANDAVIWLPGTTSPQGPDATSPRWTGNRPYTGVDVGVGDPGGWNVGVLTITLA